MLVGCGINEIQVTSTMTIVELEDAIMQRFRLDSDTFLYIPSLFSPQLSFLSGLMTANRHAELSLVDRNVSDTDPSHHHELRLYNLTLGESDLLPLICYL